MVMIKRTIEKRYTNNTGILAGVLRQNSVPEGKNQVKQRTGTVFFPFFHFVQSK